MQRKTKLCIASLTLMLLIAIFGSTVFAAGEQPPTMILAKAVAESTYTIHIPSNATLEYGNTEKQEIGKVYVTDVKGFNKVYFVLPYTDLINTSDSSDTIPLVLYDYYEYDITEIPEFIEEYFEDDVDFEILKNGNRKLTNYLSMVFNTSLVGVSPEFETGYAANVVFAKVSDWSCATPGATYQAVITFNFSAE